MRKCSLPGILLCLAVLASSLVSCAQLSSISGSGNIITKQYYLDNFTDIEISSAFEIDITSADTYSISITTYENLFQCFDVTQSGKTLKIGMKPGRITTANPKTSITLPKLNRLALSGASHGSVKGFKSTSPFELTESGASSLSMDLEVGDSKLDMSGASKVSGQIKSLNSDMELSGASRVDLSGFADRLTLKISGAGQANMQNFSIQNASMDISGASHANLSVTGKLDVDLSGASSLNYSGNPSLGKVSVTGASSLNKK